MRPAAQSITPAALPVTPATIPARRGILVPGLAAGVIAGAVMAAFLMAASAVDGRPALFPLQVIGATVTGADFAQQVTASVLVGLALHAVASVAFGVLVAGLFPPGLTVACGAALGLGYALLYLGLMVSLVVPAVNPFFRPEMQPLGGSWVIAHAVFGVTAGLVLQRLRTAAVLGASAELPAGPPVVTKRAAG